MQALHKLLLLLHINTLLNKKPNIMYVIENKEGTLPKDRSGKEKLNYADFVRDCVGATTAQGVSLNELEKRLSILAKFKNNPASVELTDDEYTLLVQCIDTTRWKLIHQDVLDFCNYIKNLKKSGK